MSRANASAEDGARRESAGRERPESSPEVGSAGGPLGRGARSAEFELARAAAARRERVEARARRRAQLVGWLVAPIGLAAVAIAVALVRNGPIEVPLTAIAVMAGVVVLWLVASILFPAHLDRHCPACGEEALEPLDPVSFQGVRCAHCEFVDRERSGYLMAEADGRVEARPSEGRSPRAR